MSFQKARHTLDQLCNALNKHRENEDRILSMYEEFVATIIACLSLLEHIITQAAVTEGHDIKRLAAKQVQQMTEELQSALKDSQHIQSTMSSPQRISCAINEKQGVTWNEALEAFVNAELERFSLEAEVDALCRHRQELGVCQTRATLDSLSKAFQQDDGGDE